MKDSSKTRQVSIILCIACTLIVPFNVIELYAKLVFDIELYSYIMALPAIIASFLLVQLAVAIALYKTAWSRTNSALLITWLINSGIICVLLFRTIPE